MAGKSSAEAVNNFIDPLRAALSCVTDVVLIASRGGYHPAAEPHAVTLGRGQPVPLRSDNDLHLSLIQHYRIVEDPDLGERGPFKCSTAGYLYSIEDDQETELIAFHWHPLGRSTVMRPHLHLGEAARLGWGDLRGAHIPSGRISVEEVVRFAITELRVAPRRDDWQEILEDTQGRYETWRTWGGPRRRQG